ncbi:MAG: hypothetical protein GF404_05570 [candidate division Zixibacteria bacterium]|nr:hypothetical protein [candidate division Zixibacteria bacterium]
MDRHWIEKLRQLKVKVQRHLMEKNAFESRPARASLEDLRMGQKLREQETALKSYLAQMTEFASGIPADRFEFDLESKFNVIQFEHGKLYLGPEALITSEPYLNFDPQIYFGREDQNIEKSRKSESATISTKSKSDLYHTIIEKYNPGQFLDPDKLKLKKLDSFVRDYGHEFAQTRMSRIEDQVKSIIDRYISPAGQTEELPSLFIYEGQFIYLTRKKRWSKRRIRTITQVDYFEGKRYALPRRIRRIAVAPEHELEAEMAAELITEEMAEPIRSVDSDKLLGYFIPTRRLGSKQASERISADTKTQISGQQTGSLEQVPYEVPGSREFALKIQTETASAGAAPEELGPEMITHQQRQQSRALALARRIKHHLQQPEKSPSQKAVLSLLPQLEKISTRSEPEREELPSAVDFEGRFEETVLSRARMFMTSQKAEEFSTTQPIVSPDEVASTARSLRSFTTDLITRHLPVYASLEADEMETISLKPFKTGTQALLDIGTSDKPVSDPVSLAKEVFASIKKSLKQGKARVKKADAETSKSRKAGSAEGISGRLPAIGRMRTFMNANVAKMMRTTLPEYAHKIVAQIGRKLDLGSFEPIFKADLPKLAVSEARGAMKLFTRKLGRERGFEATELPVEMDNLTDTVIPDRPDPVQLRQIRSLREGAEQVLEIRREVRRPSATSLASGLSQGRSRLAGSAMALAGRAAEMTESAGMPAIPQIGSFTPDLELFDRSPVQSGIDMLNFVTPPGQSMSLPAGAPQADSEVPQLIPGAPSALESTAGRSKGFLPSLVKKGTSAFKGAGESLRSGSQKIKSLTGFGSIAGGASMMSSVQQGVSSMIPQIGSMTESAKDQIGGLISSGRSALQRMPLGAGSKALEMASSGQIPSKTGLPDKLSALRGIATPSLPEPTVKLAGDIEKPKVPELLTSLIKRTATGRESMALTPSKIKKPADSVIPAVDRQADLPRGWDRPPFEVGTAIGKHLKQDLPSQVGQIATRKKSALSRYGLTVLDLEDEELENIQSGRQTAEVSEEIKIDDQTIDDIFFRLKRILETESERMGGER